MWLRVGAYVNRAGSYLYCWAVGASGDNSFNLLRISLSIFRKVSAYFRRCSNFCINNVSSSASVSSIYENTVFYVHHTNIIHTVCGVVLNIFTFFFIILKLVSDRNCVPTPTSAYYLIGEWIGWFCCKCSCCWFWFWSEVFNIKATMTACID